MFYILFVFTYSELMTEKMNARIGILPLLQAEHDRKYAMRVHAHPFLMFWSFNASTAGSLLTHNHSPWCILAKIIVLDIYWRVKTMSLLSSLINATRPKCCKLQFRDLNFKISWGACPGSPYMVFLLWFWTPYANFARKYLDSNFRFHMHWPLIAAWSRFLKNLGCLQCGIHTECILAWCTCKQANDPVDSAYQVCRMHSYHSLVYDEIK